MIWFIYGYILTDWIVFVYDFSRVFTMTSLILNIDILDILRSVAVLNLPQFIYIYFWLNNTLKLST